MPKVSEFFRDIVIKDSSGGVRATNDSDQAYISQQWY